jgi:hypothetical protein
MVLALRRAGATARAPGRGAKADFVAISML